MHESAPSENLLQYLERNALAAKLIDIALAQTLTPQHLREEAAQDIRVMWMTKTPDTVRFEPAQIAAYAHQMARHCALRCRRELGSAVRLPGSAFRKKSDGSTYVQPGTIARPLDWDEMDEWLSLEDQPDAARAGCSTGGDYVGEDADAADREEEALEVAENERRQEVFLELLPSLSDRARIILERLLSGKSLIDIQIEMGVSPSVLTREATKIRRLLDERCNEAPSE